MKKLLYILSGIIITIFIILLLLPVFYKADIIRLIEKQTNKHLESELEIGDLRLNMFKSFPHMHASIHNIKLIGQSNSDTLLFIPSVEASLTLKSLMAGNEVNIKKATFKNPVFFYPKNEQGKSEWSSLIKKKAPKHPSDSIKKKKKVEDKEINLENIFIDDFSLFYIDRLTSLFMNIYHADLKLTGEFSKTTALLDFFIDLKDVSIRHNNKQWINHSSIKLNSIIEGNLNENVYKIEQGELFINALKLTTKGELKKTSDNMYISDITIQSPNSDFKNLLALLPYEYRQHISEYGGEFSLEAQIKDEFYFGSLPAFSSKFIINNANVKFDNSTETIEDININLEIHNPGENIDSTSLNLEKFDFKISNSSFKSNLKLSNLSNPDIEGKVNGNFRLERIKAAFPFITTDLKGNIITNMSFNGTYEDIQNNEYEKFNAIGKVVLRDIYLKNSSFPKGLKISQSNINVTPSQLNLIDLRLQINSSDYNLHGNITNYFPYIFRNELLKGNFVISSDLVNLNEYTSVNKSSSSVGNGSNTKALKISDNIDFNISTNIKNIQYDNLYISNFTGNIHLVNNRAILNKVSFNMLEGQAYLDGIYNAGNIKDPSIDLNFKFSDLDIKAAYNAFTFIQKSMPIAATSEGKISSQMKFFAYFDNNMNIKMNSINGEGNVESKGLIVTQNSSLNQLSQFVKKDALEKLQIGNFKINYSIQNGNITVQPFQTTLAGNTLKMGGSQTVDGKLNYNMSLNIDRNFLGDDVNKLLKNIPGSDNIRKIEVDAILRGTLDKPEINPDLTKAFNTVTKEAQKELKNNPGRLLKELNKIFK